MYIHSKLDRDPFKQNQTIYIWLYCSRLALCFHVIARGIESLEIITYSPYFRLALLIDHYRHYYYHHHLLLQFHYIMIINGNS